MNTKAFYNYYIVVARCAHCKGNKADKNRRHIEIAFPTYSVSSKAASETVSKYPRVKKGNDPIVSVREATVAEYWELVEKNKTNPYLLAHSRQEEKLMNFDIRDWTVEEEPPGWQKNKKDDSVTRKNMFASKTKIRRPKTYAKMYAQ